MKKIIIALVLMFSAATISAQNANETYKEKTMEIVKLNASSFDLMLKPILNMIPEGNREAFKKEINASLEDLYNQLVVVYMESYTEEEVNKMLEFYHSPIGQKMVGEMPVIAEKSMKIGQEWGMKLQPLMAKYAQ